MKKHLMALAAITAVGTAVLAYLFLTKQITPARASSQAHDVDRLFSVLFAIASFFLVLCLGGLVYSLIFFRRRKGDESDGPAMFGHAPLEVTWTLVPLAIVIVLAIIGAFALQSVTAAPKEELDVRVSAFQFGWQFNYPNEGLQTNELRLPIGQPVRFTLTSRDVIHDFWVPEFRIKEDAVPGMETTLRITPDRLGDYWALCNELCGIGHAYMRAPVKVVTQEQYRSWIEGLKKEKGS